MKNKNISSFTEEDRCQLYEINNTVKDLFSQLHDLKSDLNETKEHLNEVKTKNARLKQLVNLNHYQLDSLEQYGRRKNIRFYNVPEWSDDKDDGEDKLFEFAKTLNIKLEEADLQRVHRLGKKKVAMLSLDQS